MALILNIETSSSICSVALAKDGEILLGFESSKEMDHSISLAPFVKKCIDFVKGKEEKLDAVSVSAGPGSYTGLRIGMSLAKGLAFGMNIPLITLSSLQILVVRAIFSYENFEGDEIIIPMIDARRMEVYAGVFDSSLHAVEEEKPIILDELSLNEYKDGSKVLFIGNGTEKFRPLFISGNAVWLGNHLPHAKYMVSLSELYYRRKQFSDIAYSVPFYLKEYQTTKPKSRI